MAYGIFLKASEFGQLCKPNCVFDFDGKVLEVKYLGPDKPSGPIQISQDLKVCRSDLLWDTPTRQKYLEEHFAIKCKCWKCHQDPLEVDVLKQSCLKCPKCAGGVQAPTSKEKYVPKHLKCPNCHVTVSTEVLESFWKLKPKLKKIADVCFRNNIGATIASIGFPEWKTIVEADKVVHWYDLDFLYCLMCAVDFGLDNCLLGLR